MKFQINLEISGADEKRWVSVEHDKSELAQALYIINYFFDHGYHGAWTADDCSGETICSNSHPLKQEEIEKMEKQYKDAIKELEENPDQIKKIEEIGKGSQISLHFDDVDDQEKVEGFIKALKNKGYEFADIEKENSKISSAKIIIPEKRK